MKSENLFKEPGDVIQDFFGNTVVIVAVMNETGTALDMMHIIPLSDTQMQRD